MTRPATRLDGDSARAPTENERELYAQLSSLRSSLQSCQAPEVSAELRDSALNLVHYLALRAEDRRALQAQLATLGLSSLGRCESHVLAQVDAVTSLLARVLGEPHERDEAVSASQGQALLHTHAAALLGPARGRPRVMVTLPSEAAHSPELVRTLIEAGMDLARINCAHDDEQAWRAMARNVRDVASELGRPCSIAVDLAGPKCRTGALEPGPEVLKLKPERSVWGEVQRPARAWLTSGESKHEPALPVREAFLDRLRVGSKLKLRDARGRRRKFRVESIVDGAVEIVGDRTAYLRRGTRIHGEGDVCAVERVPRREQALLLKPGDLLALTRSDEPGHPARVNGELSYACIPCEPPELLDMLREGEAVWFDDGRIGGVAETVEAERTLVRIENARAQGDKLRAGKGINLPDTEIALPALSDADRAALTFAVECADLVEYSFVRSPEDVRMLQDALDALGKPEFGVVLKIETRQSFARLPEILLSAMRRSAPGVMVARGDLAVECGFERLSEVQEEILWLCEAAHVPVIWATQVLETMAKTGRPTRAEVSDAVLAERAECVMLNKGPHVAAAVRMLDGILRRMGAHQDKKMSTLRALAVARQFSARS
jgi:pyruvate kinase